MPNVIVSATDTVAFGDVAFGGNPGTLQVPPKFPLGIAATKDLLSWSNAFPSQPVPTLSSDIDNVQTTINLTSGTGSTLPGDNFEVSIDDEIVFVGLRVVDSLTHCIRGVEQSTDEIHFTGATVQLLVTAISHNQLVSEIVAIEQFLGVLGANLPKITVNGT